MPIGDQEIHTKANIRLGRSNMNSRTSTIVCAIVALVAQSTVVAQWSSNAAANLSVADRSGEQTQSKIRATSDGGCYISWFDNSTGGYDVYLQRLDSNGVEQWAHNGVLIADRSFSSTQDYGLAVDADDNAVICYRDDRAGGTRVGVNKVSPNGTLLWGASGVLVSGEGVDAGSPRVAATSDGHYVVGWSQDGSVAIQRLDADGVTQWVAGGILISPAAGFYSMSDLHPSLSGSVIASFVHQTGPQFFNPKNLVAQRFDSDGAAMWNEGTPINVFDANSLQFGDFPSFITDGSGGAIFSWYETGGDRNAFMQHVSASGTELFAHNGVAGSIQAGRIGLNPDVAYDAANDDIYMFWHETDTNQNFDGLYGQRFRDGVRQWGDNGLEVRPLDENQEAFVNTVFAGGVAMTFAFDRPDGGLVVGHGLDVTGNAVWTGGVTTVCSNLTGKSRLDAVASACGQALLTWGDGSDGTRDILAQNVLPDGTLGVPTFPLGDVNCDQELTIDDVPLFALALVNGDAYAAQQGCCNPLNADYTMDGELAGDDIAGFVADLTN